MTETPAIAAYKPLYTWIHMMLGDTWGLHAKAWKAEYPPPPADDPHGYSATAAAHARGCYHCLVLEPDPLRNRPLFQVQVEGYTYVWNDGVRTMIPDTVRPGLEVLIDAKAQLVPANVVLGVIAEHTMIVQTPVHVLSGMQIGQIGSILDKMGGKLPSLIHKA